MSTADPHLSLTKAEIDLEALVHNCQQVRSCISSHVRLMAVVKADAYGHGLVQSSRALVATGVDFLGVACLAEALELRRAGIETPILLFGYSPGRYASLLYEFDIRASVHSLDAAVALSREAASLPGPLRIHVKVDTGMGRLGLPTTHAQDHGRYIDRLRQVVGQIVEIARLPHLHLEGIYTHFAAAEDPDIRPTQGQLSLFLDMLHELEKHAIRPELRHAANSAATIRMPESHLDMVRPGIALYGLWPSKYLYNEAITLKPVMSIKSTVIQVKEVPAGFKVSYGGTWQSKGPTRIATVPIGYADGYKRVLSSNAEMLVRGSRAQVVGRVCMDLTMIDVGHIPSIRVEDEVVVLGRQGAEEITADELASRSGTINYEIVSSLTARIPRIYRCLE